MINRKITLEKIEELQVLITELKLERDKIIQLINKNHNGNPFQLVDALKSKLLDIKNESKPLLDRIQLLKWSLLSSTEKKNKRTETLGFMNKFRSEADNEIKFRYCSLYMELLELTELDNQCMTVYEKLDSVMFDFSISLNNFTELKKNGQYKKIVIEMTLLQNDLS